MKSFSVIAAVDEKMGIGKGGVLPWRLSRDMQRFKEVTLVSSRPGKQNAVIMGRKTWDSLPQKFRPLPGRLNVVLTSRKDISLPDGVIGALSLNEALAALSARSDVADIFVIGGGMLYAQAVESGYCRALFLTHIASDFSCDVFFPRIPSHFMAGEKSPFF